MTMQGMRCGIKPRVTVRDSRSLTRKGKLMAALHLATFTCDVTPPLGHPLCGGWIEPVRGVDDPPCYARRLLPGRTSRDRERERQHRRD